MSESTSSLNDLRDIAVPDAPGLWPLAPGAWQLIALLLLLIVGAAWLFWKQRQRQAYRRAGLLLLSNATTAYDVSVVLKRVALAAYPREQVAALHGAAWINFLNQSLNGSGFDSAAFDKPEADASAELQTLAGQWIRKHQRERLEAC